jgi:hypothetical protein
MQFLLLIYHNEASWEKVTPAEQATMYKEYGQFTKEITDGGKHRAGSQLNPTATARTVRVRNGKSVVTNGPFAETKEQLGGYYLIEAKNMDEAVAIATRVPSAKDGSIEVRALVASQQVART